MKHVNPAEFETIRDLSIPSLETLSWILRHREVWPKDFVWDYGECNQCAMGLAGELWELSHDMVTSYDMATTFGMSSWAAREIFIGAASSRNFKWMESVTPEMIADDIDRYLASDHRHD